MKNISLFIFYMIFHSILYSNIKYVPTQFTTIQAALYAALGNDTILVSPGIYTENIVWPDVNGIKLISLGDTSNTILDGSNLETVIRIVPSVLIDTTTIISGFKIINGGNVSYGGGILINSASPLISNVVVSQCNAGSWKNNIYISGRGGGSYVGNNSSPVFRNSCFRSNWASDLGGGLYIDASNVTLDNIVFSNNSVSIEGVGGSGGGLYVISYSNVTASYLTFDGNAAIGGLSSGGGMNIYGHSSINISHSSFVNNAGRGAGGGIVVMDRCNAVFDDVLVKNNSVTGTSSVNGGGIIVELYSNIDISNSKIIKNVGTALTIANNCNAMLENVTIANNIGAGIDSRPSSTTVLRNVSITQNSSNAINIASGSIKKTSIDGNNGGINCLGNILIDSANIQNNGRAIINSNNLITIQAKNSWWGDLTGPFHPTQNSFGLGDTASRYSNVLPFISAPDTSAPPLPVHNVRISSSNSNSVTLTWDASSSIDLLGYRVYYNKDSSTYPYSNSIDVGNVTTYTITDLSIGYRYTFALVCYDLGNAQSWYSKEVSTNALLPVELTEFKARSCFEGIELYWKTESETNNYGFFIERRSDYANDWENIGFVEGGGTSNRPNNYYFKDKAVRPNKYLYRLKQIDRDGHFEYSNIVDINVMNKPRLFSLFQNYPNPFNPKTIIDFEIPEISKTTLKVYDVLGKEIATLISQELNAGKHSLVWDAGNYPSGIYFYTLQSSNYRNTKKCILQK